jgi:xylulokinase
MTGPLLVVDLGTSRIKFGLLTIRGTFELVFTGSSPSDFPEPGAAVQHPDQIMRICVAGLKRCADAASNIEGIVLTGQMGGLILVDRHGHACTPWFTAMDTRCAASSRLLHRLAGPRIRQLAACQPIQAERIHWAKRTQQAPPSGMALLIPAFVATQLAREGVGAAYCDRTSLGWTGLANVQRVCWSEELTQVAEWSIDGLPEIREPGTRIGHLSSIASQLTGLQAGLPLFAGPGDQAATMYGADFGQPGEVADLASTFPILTGVTNQFFVPTHTRVEMMAAAVPGKWHPLGSFRGSGALPSWFASSVVNVSKEELEREALAVGPVQDIVAVPGGGRGPNSSHITTFIGVGISHTRAHLYRALLQGLACEYAIMFAELAEDRVRYEGPISGIGGAAASVLLTSLKINMTGLTWRILSDPPPELTLIGAGLCVAHALGWPVAFAPNWAMTQYPDPGMSSSSAELLQNFKRWRRHLTDIEAHDSDGT